MILVKKTSKAELKNIKSAVFEYIHILFIAIFVVLLFLPVMIELVKCWNSDSDYSHGFLILPISIYMVWNKKKKVFSLGLNPLWGGLPVLIGGSLLYLMSSMINFHSLTYVSMIIVVFGLLLFLAGWQVTRELIGPLLFLFFMFPIPSAYYVMLTTPLKLFVTKISVLIIRLLEIPIYQEGNLIFMPNIRLEVVEACSGIRSLYSYLMLSYLFAWLSEGFVKRCVLIFSAIPLAISINVFRVTITGILSNFYGEQIAQGFYHEFTGVVLFVIGFVFLLFEFYILNSSRGESIKTGRILNF